MNTTFSLKRFWWLVRCHGAGNWKIYSIAYGVLLLLMIYLSMVGEYKLILGFYPFALGIAGILISASIYRTWHDFGHSSSFLMLPASTTEKFSVGLLFGLVLFIPLFTVLYFLSAFLTLNIFDHAITIKELWWGPKSNSESVHAFLMPTILVYLLLQPIALYSAARFRKFQFQLLILIVISMFVVYYYVQHWLMFNLTGMIAFNYSYFFIGDHINYFTLRSGGSYHMIMISPMVQRLNLCMWMVFAAGMYVVAFLRLKEREI